MTTLIIMVFIGVLVISNLITYKIGMRAGTIKAMSALINALDEAIKESHKEDEPEDQCSQ